MIRAHRNLHSLTRPSVAPWSYYTGSGGLVKGADGLTLHNVTPKHPGDTEAAKACRDGGPRAVFAWLKADWVEVGTPELPEDARRIRLDPHEHRTFMVDGEPMGRSAVVYLMPDGTAWVTP